MDGAKKPGSTRPRKKKKKKEIVSVLQRAGKRAGRCTYDWERRKILGRRGIRIDGFSSLFWMEIEIRWGDVEPSTGSGPTLNNPRYPTSDFIPCASASYGGCAIQPPGRLLNPLFSHSPYAQHAPIGDGDSIPRFLHPAAIFDAVHGRRGRGGWSWFIFVNRGRGWAVFYLGFDEFEREERKRRNVTSNDFCERGWGGSIGLSW